MELVKITEDHQSLREAGALDHALGYVRERWQFGKRIADFQGIQFMLADMVMPLEAARQLVYAAAAIDLMGRGCRPHPQPGGRDGRNS